MRTLSRMLILLIILAGAYWLLPTVQLSNLSIKQTRDAYKMDLVRQATPAIAYQIPEKQWLEFHLDTGTSQIRIINTATVKDLYTAKQIRLNDPMKRWKYALAIEVLDKEGRTLLTQIRHMRTDLSLYKDAQGREYTPSFYLQENRVPLTGMIIRLNFAGLPSADRLRVRLHSKDTDITDVVTRIYIPKKVSERKIRYMWQRLSEKAKAALAIGSVYPTELLTEDEKRALLINTWQPIGPGGHQGDYTRWDLYVLKENEGEMVDTAIPPAGMILTAKQHGVVPLPATGGHFRLHIEPIAGASKPQGNILVKWYGETVFLRQQHQLHWLGKAQDYTFQLGGGLMEIITETELSVRVYQSTLQGNEVEITPPPQYLRTYVVTPKHFAEYTINHINDIPTPIKVDFRYLAAKETASDALSPQVKYALFDNAGILLKQETIALNKIDTRYDNLVNDYSGAHLSEPSTYYFLLPAKVAKLRIQSIDNEEPVLTSVHSRPYDLPHHYRAPEDLFDFDAEGKRINAWFTLKPDNNLELLADNASTLLTVQPRPPNEAKAELLTGRYYWEDFHPLNPNWKGRVLLTPKEPHTPYREEALPSTYIEMPFEKEITGNIPPYAGLRTITPNLAWVRPQTQPATFRLFVDGHLHQTGHIAGRSGEIALLPIATGNHRLKLESDAGGRMLINHLKTSRPAHLKRLGNRLEGTLQFDIQRTRLCEETISATLFQPTNNKVRSQLRVEIQGPNPAGLTLLRSWVFPVRVFDIRPEDKAATTVFSTQSGQTDIGRSFYIPLPDYAPAGRYRITVKLEKGSGGNLLISRLSPGVQASRRVLHESDMVTYETMQD